MPSDFFCDLARNIGTTLTTILTVGANDHAVVIGLQISNTTVNAVKVDVVHRRSALDYYVVKDVPVDPGSAIDIFQNSKRVLQANDVLLVKSDTASSVDAGLSRMKDSNL